MNPYLHELPEGADELTLPLLAHRLGDRGLDDLQAEAASDPSDWPAEWKTYERKLFPRFDDRRVPLDQLTDQPTRQSTRQFGGGDISLDELSQVLAGVRIWRTESAPLRECPSAGGLFPIECYLLVRDGDASGQVCYYDAEAHELVKTLSVEGDLFTDPTSRLGTSTIVGASAFVVLTSVMYRTMRKYGARGYRYALLEAGAFAYEIDRSARNADLATCWLGGFDDEGIAELIGCRPAIDMEIPLLLLALGRPLDSSHSEPS